MTLILSNPRERTRFFRFAFVGVIGAAVDFGVMNLLTARFHYPLVLAGTISFIAAVLSNFTWNRYWTYPDSRSKPMMRQLLIFTVVSIIGLAIRVPLLVILEPIVERIFSQLSIHWPYFTSKFYADNFVLAIAVVIVMFWNFFVNRYWTYNDVE
jgi:putative flippase GtrA